MSSPTLVRRATATIAVLIVALAGAPAAVAGEHSPIETKKKHSLKDGCFTASYDDDTWASQTMYFKNRCKTRHKLRVYKFDGGTQTDTFTVGGGSKGSKRYWNYGGRMGIEDLGRA
ncbi:hypothetical protein H181DRAFT_04508 [Streptomyces sp. WMMB 714]|uniref:hypothetical protein n=1 Tax=Streptomyces sp. WMMB 714 TaxID=1286822 RepID=UPI000823DAEE|nr:hypothetical protein [Streptomyces sp. WMMB 714]SCK49966.1 hypothetical protein H181DRAFT_04508 [Streptomyces sp. WMMB 714]